MDNPAMHIDDLEFHGCEVARIDADGASLRIVLAAAHVRRWTSASAATFGYLTGVTLTLTGAAPAGATHEHAGRVADGRLVVDGLRIDRPRVPGSHAGAIELQIAWGHGAALRVRGTALDIAVRADASFVEDFAC